LLEDRTLIQVRERSFLDLQDLALVAVRNCPGPIILSALAGVAPCAILNAWFIADPEFPFFWYLVLLILEIPWATAPLTVVLGGLMFGERPSARRVLRALVRGLPGMILYQGIVRAIFMLVYPVLPSRLGFLNEVVLLERGKLTGVLRRCQDLASNRVSDFFGQWLAQLFFALLFIACFWFGTGAALSSLTTSELTWEEPYWAALYGLRCQLAVWLTIGFFGVARFLAYIDQRIRIEGWELKLRLLAVGRALEEAGRW
jgi:hypothetical protein